MMMNSFTMIIASVANVESCESKSDCFFIGAICNGVYVSGNRKEPNGREISTLSIRAQYRSLMQGRMIYLMAFSC